LAARQGDWAATITADRNDEIGCLVWDVTVNRTAAVEPQPSVQTWAEALPSKVRGLMENLKLVEVDTGKNQALLRSEEPTHRGDAAFYYEVVLTGLGTANVKRFQAARPAARREQVAFALTHEVLAKLAGDLTGDAI